LEEKYSYRRFSRFDGIKKESITNGVFQQSSLIKGGAEEAYLLPNKEVRPFRKRLFFISALRQTQGKLAPNNNLRVLYGTTSLRPPSIPQDLRLAFCPRSGIFEVYKLKLITMEYPYTLKTGTLKEVFGKILSIGVPETFTIEHLKSLGYKSSNDYPIVKILKFIGFIDAGGKPTEKYRKYRSKDKRVLADGIRNGYGDLFNLYPDANQKDDESLTNFFASKTDGGASTLGAMVGTFKALCSLAVFDNQTETMMQESVSNDKAKEIPIITKTSKNPVVNINIELQIPPTNDPEIYKNFFEALKKYLLND
jgi:hypothetical protein